MIQGITLRLLIKNLYHSRTFIYFALTKDEANILILVKNKKIDIVVSRQKIKLQLICYSNANRASNVKTLHLVGIHIKHLNYHSVKKKTIISFNFINNSRGCKFG